MGRRGKNSEASSNSAPFVEFNLPPVSTLCPTVHKITTSNEMHLFDLASVQLELERILASVTERIICLSAESKCKQLPPSLLNSLRHRMAVNDSESNGRPSLVVKANPDKPLTLIIAQRNRFSQPVPPLLPVPDPPEGIRSKLPSSAPFPRRNSRSFDESSKRSPTSTDAHQASYAIPNKFWELMEPYCAEITEANINYLENMIRSYQDVDSAYLQLPPLPADAYGEPCPSFVKRSRRELSDPAHIHSRCGPSSSSPHSAMDSSQVQLARDIDVELKKPLNSSSMLGKLSQSLLSCYYQENVLTNFKSNLDALYGSDTEVGGCSMPESHTSPEHTPVQSMMDSDPLLPDCSFQLPSLPDLARERIAAKASQSLKALAKELHVSTCYRLEKKISQAMDELGLVPLNFIHPQQQSAGESCVEAIPVTRSQSVTYSSDPLRIKLTLSPAHDSVLKVPPGSSPYTDDAVGNRSDNCHSHNLRSPSSAKKSSPDERSLNAPGARRLRRNSNFIKSDESDCPTLVNGGSSTAHRWKRSSLKRRRRTQCPSLRQQSIVSTNLSTANMKDGSDTEHEPEGSADHLSSPKLSKDPILNGILTSDEDTDQPNEVDSDLPSDRSRTRGGVGKRANHDGSPSLATAEDRLGSYHSSDAGDSTLLANGDPNQTVDYAEPDHSPHHGLSFTVNGNASDFKACVSGADGPPDPMSSPAPHLSSNANSSIASQRANDAVFVDQRVTDSPALLAQEVAVAAPALDSFGKPTAAESTAAPSAVCDLIHDELGQAIWARQQELRLVCAENLSVLRRLVQAARRDMQRQEIQRRLAIADADVMEAYNKLESYRPQRKVPLKRDRDSAYKALKERKKILKELELFDAKSP